MQILGKQILPQYQDLISLVIWITDRHILASKKIQALDKACKTMIKSFWLKLVLVPISWLKENVSKAVQKMKTNTEHKSFQHISGKLSYSVHTRFIIVN